MGFFSRGPCMKMTHFMLLYVVWDCKEKGKKKNDPPVLGRYMNKQKLNSNNIAYHIKMLKLLK